MSAATLRKLRMTPSIEGCPSGKKRAPASCVSGGLEGAALGAIAGTAVPVVGNTAEAIGGALIGCGLNVASSAAGQRIK